MRHILTIVLVTVLSLQLTAQSSIKFKKNPMLENLLAQAKAENKFVFIDAYTTWCGPCKMMDRDVFTDKAVGAFYNENFINAKIDMEKGEGPQIAQTYQVRGYPSFLFLDEDGAIVHRGIGYIESANFLELGEMASGSNSMKALGEQYESKKDDPEFLYKYASTLVGLGESDKAEKVVAAYLETTTDWSGKATMELIMGSPGPLAGKRMKYMIENAEAFASIIGSSEFINTTQHKFILTQMQIQGKRMLPSQGDMDVLYTEHAGKLKQQLSKHYTMMSAENRRDRVAYANAAIAYYDAYPADNSQEMNALAWHFYENVKDKQQLLKAVEWAKLSVKLSKAYHNMDTLAWLYYKTGQRNLAKKTAEEAIVLAKATGQDYSETAKILN